MLKNEIINFFQYTFGQRAFVLMWVVLSILIFSTPYAYRYLFPPAEVDLSNFESEIAKLREKEGETDKTFAPYYSEKKSNYKKRKNESEPKIKTQVALTPFTFDPNTASEADFTKMGLPAKKIKTIINYRNKGGKFFQKEDLKKIYGITQREFEQLEPFISIIKEKKEYKKPTVEKPKPTKKVKKVVRVDVNQATVDDWQKLKGIGPYYAKKIINFRDKLGGFYSIEQIGTTYGLKDSTFQIVKPFLDLSPIFRKIEINTFDIDELKNHPYIKWQQAKVIVKYRENHGAFATIYDLGKVGVFSEDDLSKLKPYLDF